VAFASLAGPPVAAPVMGDDAIAVQQDGLLDWSRSYRAKRSAG
jgi:hypothetical protein